jgi:hypothetical protein
MTAGGGETRAEPSGWSVDTLHSHLQREIDDLRSMLNERYATQTKAIDAAFLAQQTAMQTAFTAADRAVQAALDAAEKAVSKAEVAAEKRFENVNEFRGQLADQAATFLSRTEYDASHQSLIEKIEALQSKVDSDTSRNAVAIQQMNSRLDLNQGQDVGAAAQTANQRQVTTIVVSVLVLAVLILGYLAARK